VLLGEPGRRSDQCIEDRLGRAALEIDVEQDFTDAWLTLAGTQRVDIAADGLVAWSSKAEMLCERGDVPADLSDRPIASVGTTDRRDEARVKSRRGSRHC
jgi:hypothetical protein